MCDITSLIVTAIAFSCYYLLTILSRYDKTPLTNFQKSMFRAGHAYEGALVIISSVVQLMLDNIQSGYGLKPATKIGFPLAATLVSGGSFASPRAMPERSLINLLSYCTLGFYI